MKFPGIKTILAALLLVLWAGTALTARTNPQPLYEQGLEAFKAGNFGSAELMFRKIVEAGNDGEVRDRAWYHLALSIFNQKKYKDAIFEFNRFLLICTLQQLCLESRYWIAESYFFLKDYIRAIQEYKRFIAQSKDEILKVASYDRIGEIYFFQSRFDEAIIEWREAINLSGNIAQNNARVVKIGEALYLNESYDESLNLLESLLRSKIDREEAARARMIIGAVYQLKNRHRDAFRIFSGIPEQLLKQAPFYDAQYFKALSSMELGDNYSAKSLLESFLLIGKDSEWYYNAKYQLGAILLKEGREKDGLALLEEVRSSTRKMGLRSKAALILGNLYLKKDPREAIPYLEDAVSLDEPAEQKNVMLLLSRVYIEVERYGDAERLLQLLISAYPGDRKNDQVQFLISQVYLNRGEVEKALEGFEKIREINPGSPYIKESNYFRALAYEKMGRINQALEALNAYVAIPGVENRYEALVRMAGMYLKSDDITNAEKRMNQIITGYLWRNGVERVLLEYGMALKEKENTNYSRYFNLVLNRFPKSEAAGEVLLLWGDDYFEKKNYAQSERMYRMYLSVGGRKNAGSVFLYRVISLYHLERYRDLVTAAGGTDLPEMSGYTKKQVDLWKGRAHYRLKSYDLAYGTFVNYPLRDYEPPDLMIIMRSSLEVGDVSMAQTVNGMLAESDHYRPEARFVMGEYYAGIGQPEVAEEYYRDLLSNDAGSPFADRARLELTRILIGKGVYQEALDLLAGVRGEKLKEPARALRIFVLFKIGKDGEAAGETRANLKALLDTAEAETVVRENLRHYYRKGDTDLFKTYAVLLNRYPGNANLVNFLWGKLNLDKGQFNAAYYYFYKSSQAENDCREESLYHLGMISMIHQKNNKLAMVYFSRLAAGDPAGSIYVARAKINLSILHNETGNTEKSLSNLKEIHEGVSGAAIKIQAENLMRYFGDEAEKPVDARER